MGASDGSASHHVSSALGAADRVTGADAAGSVTYFLGRLASGDPAGADELWKRYFPRVTALARRTLAGRLQRSSDADDAAQSAFISFWQRVERGRMPAEPNRDGLWRLLATITVRKARKQLERERAAKRGGGRVIGEDQLARGGAGESGWATLDELAGDLATHEFDLHCAELLLTLDAEQRNIALLRLMGHGTEEIAEQLGCTRRKVQRKLELVRLRWEQDWGIDSEQRPKSEPPAEPPSEI
jgi:RNA polymerase sigma factor (sigma-70 family)